MTPQSFIAKWQHNELTERAGAQAHFLDLCELLGQPKPADPENYCFERGAHRTGGNHGWADYTPDMLDEEILRRLQALNLERSARSDVLR
jgi:hypothetical protein